MAAVTFSRYGSSGQGMVNKAGSAPRTTSSTRPPTYTLLAHKPDRPHIPFNLFITPTYLEQKHKPKISALVCARVLWRLTGWPGYLRLVPAFLVELELRPLAAGLASAMGKEEGGGGGGCGMW